MKSIFNYWLKVNYTYCDPLGDMLFIPALWFHNMKALDAGIAINVFWKNLPEEVYDKKDPYGNKDLLPAAKGFKIVYLYFFQIFDWKFYHLNKLDRNLRHLLVDKSIIGVVELVGQGGYLPIQCLE